jgi:ureidoglycolate hydrolase
VKDLKIAHVSAENFMNLGQIVTIPIEGSRKVTLESPFFKFYGGLGIMDFSGPMELGVCTFRSRDFVVEELEQHAHTQELLYAIDGDFIMPVAPIEKRNGGPWPDLSKITAISVRQGEGVIFHRGIWHWAPFPLQPVSSVLVGFAKDTAENDLVIRKLDATFRLLM